MIQDQRWQISLSLIMNYITDVVLLVSIVFSTRNNFQSAENKWNDLYATTQIGLLMSSSVCILAVFVGVHKELHWDQKWQVPFTDTIYHTTWRWHGESFPNVLLLLLDLVVVATSITGIASFERMLTQLFQKGANEKGRRINKKGKRVLVLQNKHQSRH